MAFIVSSVERVCRSCPLSVRLQNMRTINIADFRQRVRWTLDSVLVEINISSSRASTQVQ